MVPLSLVVVSPVVATTHPVRTQAHVSRPKHSATALLYHKQLANQLAAHARACNAQFNGHLTVGGAEHKRQPK
jgi:hypothetical protein